MYSFSGRNLAREAADLAYRRVVEQARQAVFFTDYGVPDTLDGRFELICLHAFLYLHRLKGDRPQASRFWYQPATGAIATPYRDDWISQPLPR